MLHYIKLLLRYALWLIILPVVCAATVFFLTKHTKKQYTSLTTLYTGVASGYSITSTEDERLDYFAVNNAFDNLLASAKSRETIEQVALHLLAEHLLLTKPDIEVLGADGFESLKKLAGAELMNKAKQLKDAQRVYNYISGINASKTNNIITKILNEPGSYYNIDDLNSSLVVTRINTSDLIKIVYTCTDPGVCQRVLELHSTIFTANYRRLKADQTDSAVQYFENKLAQIKAKLAMSEDDLKDFGQKNRIINYYEQTRYIAESKEQLDKEIYAEKVVLSGSKKTLEQLSKKLSTRDKQVLNGSNIISLREKLSETNANIERAKIYANPQKVEELTKQSKTLEDSIANASGQYMQLNYSVESVPRTNLIQEWVENTIAYDKASAGLSVLTNQRQNYLQEFDTFAPLGSTVKRLDRQVDINEKEFLAILHGLNLARLRQSNLALNSNIVIQDKPFFPLKALPSTRNLLVIVSFIVGLILVAATVIGRELMDSSIRNPDRAKKIIDLQLAGISIQNDKLPAPAYQQVLKNILTEQLVNTILQFIAKPMEQHGQAQVALLATRDDVYNTEDIKLLHTYFSALFSDVNWVVPASYETSFSAALPTNALHVYTPGVVQLNYKNISQLIKDSTALKGLIFYVTPNLAANSLPVAIATASDLNLLVVNAGNTWLTADNEILLKTKTMLAAAPFLSWLVSTHETNLDSIIAEIPKQRSWLRKKIKKLVTLNLI